MKILETIGTLQLIDTGHRCSTRNVRQRNSLPHAEVRR